MKKIVKVVREGSAHTKTDEFSEKFQTAFDPCAPAPQNGPFLWKSCACISYYLALIPTYMQPYVVPSIFEGFVSNLKKLQHNFPKMMGGGKRQFGIFSKIYPFWYPEKFAPIFQGNNFIIVKCLEITFTFNRYLGQVEKRQQQPRSQKKF